MGWMRNSTVAVVLAIIALVVIAFVVKTQVLKTEEKNALLVKSKSDPTYTTTLMLASSEMGKEVYADAKAKDLVPAYKVMVTLPGKQPQEQILTQEEQDALIAKGVSAANIVPVEKK